MEGCARASDRDSTDGPDPDPKAGRNPLLSPSFLLGITRVVGFTSKYLILLVYFVPVQGSGVHQRCPEVPPCHIW